MTLIITYGQLMTKKRYTKKKKKPVTDFPYEEIKTSISWFDAQSNTGWLTHDKMKKLKPAESKTKGWIFQQTDDYITNFGTYSIDPDSKEIEFGEVICIPKNWV